MYYLQIIIGALVLLLLGAVFSNNAKNINFKYLISAILLQFMIAILLIKVPLITAFFENISQGVLALKAATDQGTGFVFGYLADGTPKPFEVTNPASANIFIFSGLMLIIVVSALSAILWHWKILPIIIKFIATLFKKPLNVGGPVGLSATANIIFGQVEAPLLIRPYLKQMTKHELLVLMTVGMSTISGGVMVVFVTMLSELYTINLITHFLTASIISVPAAIMYANIMIPSNTITDFNENKVPKVYKSTMDAVTSGGEYLDVIYNYLIPFANKLIKQCNFFIIDKSNVPFSIPLIGDISPDFPVSWLTSLPFSSLANEVIDESEKKALKKEN